MDSYEVTLNVKRNGVPVDALSIVKRIEVDEAQQFAYEKAADNDATTFTAMPTDQIGTIQLLVVKADRAVTLRLDAQSDAGIELNAGGMLIVMDATINAGVSTNAKINNPHASLAALVEGIAAGT
jgi:hypothetical protein